jgi:hypothetical protein
MRAQVRSLFQELADLAPAERQRVLSERGIAPDVAAEVESLLSFDSADARSLTDCVSEAAEELLRARDSADTVNCGPYRLVRLLASGGMGSVYLGERDDGEIRQQVAIKLLRTDGHRPEWRQRFLNERQLLASLNHASIVRILDAGHTADGRPYLVMEYVEGTPIDAYAERLEVGARLKLFLSASEGVSHAHQRLIIHRDLKPSNILVDASGQPKVLDFGIGKLLDGTGEPTKTIEQMLTPQYASPEQLSGRPQTTATDIYSLGAVLHKLLAGRAPRESGPPAPLPKDLRCILDKALRAEPEERYVSVEAFANDIHAFLECRPVEARSGNAWYRTRKFVRHYRMPVIAALLVIASLAAGLYFANRQRGIAERRFTLARKLANSLLFDIHDKVPNVPGGIALREQLSTTGVEYLDALSKEAGNNYQLRRELADGYVRLASDEFAGSQAAPRPGGTTSLETTNRALALLEGMPAREFALASVTEAKLRDRRCSLLRQASRLEAAKPDCERAVDLLPCGTTQPEQCQSRVFALSHQADVLIGLRDWPTAERAVAAMRRDSETLRSAGHDTLYESNLLVAGLDEARIRHLQHSAQDAVPILRGLLPVAEKLEVHSQLSPAELYALFEYYDMLPRCMRAAGLGPPQERMVFDRKAIVFARRRAELDPDDVVAQVAAADTLGSLARDSESVEPADAARSYREAIESLARRPDLMATNIGPRVSLYVVGQNGIRFFLSRKDPASAVECARRVSVAISPAMFLKLNLPRSGDVVNLQGLWWTAFEASSQNASSADQLWAQALRAAEAGLRTAPNDATMKASAAFVFEGQQAESYHERARALWRELAATYPQNDFILKRAAGVFTEHNAK